MADTKTVQIIIEAQAKVDGAMKEVQSKMTNLQKSTSNFQKQFTSLTTAIAGSVAFSKLKGFLDESIQAAGEAAKVQAQLGAVLKSTGGVAGITAEKAIELSQALQKQTTYGDEAILSAENLLLTFTNIGKDVFPDAIKTVLDMSTALGQDTKSSAVQLGKALQDPILGVSALRKVGVNFTEAQQEQIKVLVESGKAMEAQKLILKELAIEFGGSASAEAETFAGKMKQLNERVGDLKESVGNALVPVINKLLEKIAPVVEKIITWIEKNPELTQRIILGAVALAGLVTVLGVVGTLLPSIIGGVKLLGTALQFFAATPLGAVIVALTGLAVLIDKIIKRFYELKQISYDAAASAANAKVINQKTEDLIAQKKAKGEDTTNLESALKQSQQGQQTLENIANASLLKKIGIGLGIGSYDKGGLVPGPTGEPQLAVVHGGERVLTADEANGRNAVYNITFNGDITDKAEFMRKLKDTMSQVLSVRQAMP